MKGKIGKRGKRRKEEKKEEKGKEGMERRKAWGLSRYVYRLAGLSGKVFNT